MPELKELLERKKEVSGQVSSQTRALSLGLLAISWVFLTAHDEPLRTMVAHVPKTLILIMGLCAAFALASDLFQYVLYTKSTDEAIKRARVSPNKSAQYDDHLRSYRAAGVMYRAKFYLLIGCSIMLLAIIVLMLL